MLEQNLKGLSTQEVEAARAQYGANVLTPPPRDPWWVQFRAKFDDPVIRILIIAASISFFVGLSEGHVSPESVGIIIAILLATGLAFINEFRANKEFDVLNQSSDEASVKVIRDGAHALVPRRDVVVGDLVELNQGDEIPADGNVLTSTALEVNESAFTGESLPARKAPAPRSTAAEGATDIISGSAESGTYGSDQLLRSTMVVDGSGAMRVSTIGDATEIGKTARLSTEETGEQSPLNAQLERLSKWIGVIGFTIAAGTFAALAARGILQREIVLSAAQGVATACAGVGIIILLAPIWLPLIYDFFELTGREKEPPAWLEAGAKTWLGLALLGALVFAILIGAAIALSLGGLTSDTSTWFARDASQRFLEFFMIAVTIIVVAVPEGLAMSVTLSLAYSMRRMTATNCLVRRMDACETIGAATHICSDKTGTLTMNQMRVQEGYFGHNDKAISEGAQWQTFSEGPGLIYEGIAVNSTANLGASNMGQKDPSTTAARQTDASAAAAKSGRPEVIGNPTEGALLLKMSDDGQDYEAVRGSFETIRQWPFSTERKFMATVGKSPRSGQVLAHFKGAPDILLARCTHIVTAEGTRPIEEHKAQIEAALVDCQSRAMRTLGFGVREAQGATEDSDLEELAQNLTWLGFTAIADPIRPEVPAAIQKCRQAGIDVKIVTGDNPLTAREIARQIGLWEQNGTKGSNGTNGTNGSSPSTSDGPLEGQIILGPEFAALTDEEALDAAQRIKVMARARPADKLRLVDSLQKRQAVVAVTGDGTNDAPALNYAQVGLAMGQAGTAVAKEASDIIILDDSFGSIATAVKWGRSLYLNIQKFILFQLTINVVACGIALLGPFIGIELPLTVMQMLWVNLIMDTFAALALATEPPEEKVMDHKPRGPNDFIVSPEMMRKIFGVGIFFILLLILAIKLPVFSDQSIVQIEASHTAAVANEAAREGAQAAQVAGQDGSGALQGKQGHSQRGAASPETTAFFTFFVLLQFWNMFNARTLGSNKSAFSHVKDNPYFLTMAGVILVGQFLIVTFGGTFFRVVPLEPLMWIKLIAVTSLVLVVGEILRALSRASEGKRSSGNVGRAAVGT